MKSTIVWFTLLFSVHVSFAQQDVNLDPAYLRLKVYKFAVSTDPLCTNPRVIFESNTAEYVDLLDTPTLGSGIVADGTYHCVIIEFSDMIAYAPNTTSTSGNCVSNTGAMLDVCESGTSRLIDGTDSTCTNGEDRIAMYLSTASTRTTASNFANPPTVLSDGTNGFNLGSALEVNSRTLAKFVVNATDKICDASDDSCPGIGSTCFLAPPLFSFEKITNPPPL